jgi:hypothetical protein
MAALGVIGDPKVIADNPKRRRVCILGQVRGHDRGRGYGLLTFSCLWIALQRLKTRGVARATFASKCLQD